MRCPTCKADDAVEAKVALRLQVPLAKGGGVKLIGAFTQDEIRVQWLRQQKNCVCVRCGAAYLYVDGEGLVAS